MVIDKAISIKNTNVAEEKGNEKLKFNDIEEKEKLLENSKKEAEAIIQAKKFCNLQGMKLQKFKKSNKIT